VIRAEALTARAPPVRIGPLSFALGAGLHAVVGAREDGVGLLLAVLGARLRVRSGVLQVEGRPLELARASIAYVPLDTSLPDALRVDETLALAARMRGEPLRSPTERLATLGIAPLSTQPVRNLSQPETRAVAVAEAVTSSARVVILEEPYVTLDPRAAPLLEAALRARAASGACIVIGTASPRDAAALADDQLILHKGLQVRAGRTNAADVTRGTGGARLRLRVGDARALLGELATETAVRSIQHERAEIVVTGEELVPLATAVGRAVVRAGVRLDAMLADAPTLEALRVPARSAAAAGQSAAAPAAARPAAPAPRGTP
jgi:ABC-2 type transport system ATP-binding protein